MQFVSSERGESVGRNRRDVRVCSDAKRLTLDRRWRHKGGLGRRHGGVVVRERVVAAAPGECIATCLGVQRKGGKSYEYLSA